MLTIHILSHTLHYPRRGLVHISDFNVSWMLNISAGGCCTKLAGPWDLPIFVWARKSAMKADDICLQCSKKLQRDPLSRAEKEGRMRYQIRDMLISPLED